VTPGAERALLDRNADKAGVTKPIAILYSRYSTPDQAKVQAVFGRGSTVVSCERCGTVRADVPMATARAHITAHSWESGALLALRDAAREGQSPRGSCCWTISTERPAWGLDTSELLEKLCVEGGLRGRFERYASMTWRRWTATPPSSLS
jgi:hypothetical protein